MSMGDESSRFARREVLIQQLKVIVEATTGSTTFKEGIRKGIEHGWIGKVFVRGLTSQGRILQQIEIEIDWEEHLPHIASIRYQLNQYVLQIARVEHKPNRFSDLIGKAVELFDKINQEVELKAEWGIVYTPE